MNVAPLTHCLPCFFVYFVDYVVDAIHDTVQPAGQVAAAEMVRCTCRQSEEEDRS